MKKLKSPVATTHIYGICREYDELNEAADDGRSDDDVYSDEEIVEDSD